MRKNSVSSTSNKTILRAAVAILCYILKNNWYDKENIYELKTL